jgi:hypothetical protein
MRSTVRVERGESGRRLAVAREVRANPADAWVLFAKTTHWPSWGSTVTAVRPPDVTIREGSTGEVQVLNGPWVPFEVTSFDVDESRGVRRWTWRVARVPATGHRVADVDGGCRVVFEVPLWGAGYVPVCQRALANLTELLDGD